VVQGSNQNTQRTSPSVTRGYIGQGYDFQRYGWNIAKNCYKQQTTLNITITVLTHNPIHIKQHSTETKDVTNSVT
jgi:hypothetical protein